MSSDINISIAEAVQLTRSAFCAAGIGPREAQSVADALVTAEACGLKGHGLSRLDSYIEQVQSGKINPHAKIRSTRSSNTSIHIDADHGFAYPALELAAKIGGECARNNGMAVVAIHNSHHCGALALSVEKLASAGMIALLVANSPKAMAAWGAKQPLFGTNPIAFAAPQQQGEPLVIDLSLSRVARGQVVAAAQMNQPIPSDWALDSAGKPTTDATRALAGTMQPIGGAKGIALALVVEILAAAFTGANFSFEASSFLDGKGAAPGVGQLLLIIDANSAAANFLERMTFLLQTIEQQPGARVPGTRRRATYALNLKNGLTVPRQRLARAQALAASAAN